MNRVHDHFHSLDRRWWRQTARLIKDEALRQHLIVRTLIVDGEDLMKNV
jgi:hypothetical protein